MKKRLLIIFGIIVCLFGIFKLSQKSTVESNAKNIPSHEIDDLLVKDNIIHQVPRMPYVYNISYHIDNKKKIVYMVPRNPGALKDEMKQLRTTPIGMEKLKAKTPSENKFSLLSTQIAKKYGNAWKVQVLSTNAPAFSNLRKRDILWQFQNGKEKGRGTQGILFKLERIALTPFDYLVYLIVLIILALIAWFTIPRLIRAFVSDFKAYFRRYARIHLSQGYQQPKRNRADDFVTETHYDQYGNAHDVTFKKGDYSRGYEGNQSYNMNPNGSYDSDDRNTHFDN